MQKLICGIHQFQTHVFRSKKELFGKLADGQTPSALFITCSDSRINPNLLTQTEPGEIFVLRNAGNIVPPHPDNGGEIATIEFALKGLKIRDIIVCGHSDCGAMKALLQPGEHEQQMPAVTHWLGHAQRTADIIAEKYVHLKGREQLMATIAENVIVQIENLRTHAVVDEALAAGDVKLHGWVYKFETGQVFHYEADSGQFVPLGDSEEPHPVYPYSLNQRHSQLHTVLAE